MKEQNCTYIFKKGSKMGQKCDSVTRPGEDLCSQHKPEKISYRREQQKTYVRKSRASEPIPDDERCTNMILSGKRKGERCLFRAKEDGLCHVHHDSYRIKRVDRMIEAHQKRNASPTQSGSESSSENEDQK